jgi:hypothetical protein
MSYGKRYATPGEGRVLRRDLEHALGDEQRIQKCRQILRWMRAGGAERAWEIYQAVQETEQVLRAEVMDLLGEQRFRREEPADWYFVEVEGVRTRVSEKTGARCVGRPAALTAQGGRRAAPLRTPLAGALSLRNRKVPRREDAIDAPHVRRPRTRSAALHASGAARRSAVG